MRWVGTRQNAMGDPLLFIESIPVPETRVYIKQVLTYYWMYARRTGEAAPTLDETAAGSWPRYRPHGAVAGRSRARELRHHAGQRCRRTTLTKALPSLPSASR